MGNVGNKSGIIKKIPIRSQNLYGSFEYMFPPSGGLEISLQLKMLQYNPLSDPVLVVGFVLISLFQPIAKTFNSNKPFIH